MSKCYEEYPPIIVKKINEVYAKIECGKSQALELRQFISFFAPNYIFHPKFKAGLWDGKLYLFDISSHLLPIGALTKFIDFCKAFKYEYAFNFSVEELFNNVPREGFERALECIFPTDCDYYPRDYQEEAIYRALTNKRGVLQLATGSGKSLVQYALVRYMIAENKKVILVVPSISLVEQMYSDFKEYNWTNIDKHVSLLYGGKEIDRNKEVLITTWQSIYSKDVSFFNDFDGLIIDEAHQSSSLSLQNICKKCVNASYRIGLTGTLPKEEATKWTIYGYLGPTLYELKSKELIDRGVLSKIEIKNVIAKYPEEMCHSYSEYCIEQKTIIDYKRRFKVLDHIIEKLDEKDNTLVLVQRIEYLKHIVDYLLDNHQKYEILVIYGNTAPEEREKIRKSIDVKDNVILVCTYGTMSTGVSIKKINNIVFFESYKSEIKVLQSIGRGLRKHPDKEKVVLYDVIDDMRYDNGSRVVSNYVYSHWEKFRKVYYKEQEFETKTEEVYL